MGFAGRDIISILDFTREDLLHLFERAEKAFEEARHRPLQGKVLALAFFEPSTRTRLSFEVAMKRLGGDTIGFTSEEAISVAKGESFADTIRMLDAYADAIVVRHRYEGAALYAAEIAEHPVINAGDGKQHHPTQAMIDLYTVYKLFGTIDGLVYGVLGDLRYARAANSFILGLSLFKPEKIYLISPPQLRLRRETREIIASRGVRFEEVDNVEEVLGELDVLYVVRIQKERFPDPAEYEKVRGSYRLTRGMVEKHAKKTLKILHPLPRVDELDPRLDETPYAAYFTQARLGVPLRMALLLEVMGV